MTHVGAAGAVLRGGAFPWMLDLDAFLAARCLMGMMIVFAITQEVLGGEKVHALPRRKILDAIAGVFLDGVAAGRGRRRPAGGRGPRRTS